MAARAIGDKDAVGDGRRGRGRVVPDEGERRRLGLEVGEEVLHARRGAVLVIVIVTIAVLEIGGALVLICLPVLE